MEVASQEEHDMPIPINTTHGGHGHMIHRHHDHRHHNPANSTHPNPLIVLSNGNGFRQNHEDPDHHNVGYNIMISNNKEKHVVNQYKECLKNHAASTGGHAIDGCGEFMPSGEEGSIEALTCSACHCHRNFHRREIEGEDKTYFSPYHHNQPQRNPMFHHHHKMTRSPLPQQMIMPLGVATTTVSNSESEEDIPFQQPPPPYNHGGHNQKKRLRTKFTQEQKEKMLSFAERIGWKMQRQEESVVQKFCQEIGVRRRVLKVWIHNNKHNLSKKSNNNNVEISAGNNDINKALTGNRASSS
uniref:ZF-HD dimerization-type domain-containing protein n=1 Tax=Brassica oleracea TaxID=3712 RepID=A0A3P6E317_BRAOL|nr:unnamed protein product [Brassica oleracea]